MMDFLPPSPLSRRRQWHPTPVLLPGKSHGWRSLVGCSPWGCEESDTTERLHFHFSLSCIGEGNGNPLQCSCLENPREGGAWWAAVYGSHRVGHDWSDAAAAVLSLKCIWPSSREAWSSCMKNCRRSRRYSLSPESFFNFWKAVRGADPLSPIRGQADLSPYSNLYGFFTWGLHLFQKYRTSHMKPWNDCLSISTLAAAILFFFLISQHSETASSPP